MQKVDQIIHAKWLITCENDAVLNDHALIIKDKKIFDIQPSKNVASLYQSDSIENFNSHAVLPGFINSHTHSAMNLFRGLADDLELMDWLTNHIWPTESKWVSEKLVYDGAQLAIAEMIRSGTTCFNDMYFFMDQVANAAANAGIRANIGMTVINVPTVFAKSQEEYFEKALTFYDQFKQHELVKPTLAPHSTYSVDQDGLERIKLLSDQLGLKINMHLQEAPSEIERSLQIHKKRPSERLQEIGLLNDKLIAIHMTQLTDAEIDSLAATKLSVVHCPESNMKLVSGNCRVQQLLDKGINVALGTDGAASNNDLDMISEMRSAAFLGKVTANDPKACSAETVLKMATINGAKALGIDDLTGSLKVGKSADFIAISLDHIETQPLYHPISQIVYASGRNHVTDVFVAGRRLMKNRQLLTLDEEALLAKAKEWQRKIA